MNTINLTLSAINDLKPTTINGIDCDGIVGGRPVNIRRNRYDGVVPAIGQTFKSCYGTARVVGYVEGALKVRIIEFNEDYDATKEPEPPDKNKKKKSEEPKPPSNPNFLLDLLFSFIGVSSQ